MLIWFLVTRGVLTERTSPQSDSARTGGSSVEDLDGRAITLVVKTESSARLVLMEFSDFECPYCARHARDTFPRLSQEFVESGKISYAFKHFPLESVHTSAFRAAETAACAGQQGRFWQTHRLLFGNAGGRFAEFLNEVPSVVGLDRTQFVACRERIGGQIRLDLAEGARLGVRSTPTFFVGQRGNDGKTMARRRINGAQPYEVFRATIQEMIDGYVSKGKL